MKIKLENVQVYEVFSTVPGPQTPFIGLTPVIIVIVFAIPE